MLNYRRVSIKFMAASVVSPRVSPRGLNGKQKQTSTTMIMVISATVVRRFVSANTWGFDF